MKFKEGVAAQKGWLARGRALRAPKAERQSVTSLRRGPPLPSKPEYRSTSGGARGP